MSEAQDAVLGFPCDHCGADVGEPCQPECVGFQAGEDWPEADELVGTPPLAVSASKLATAVHKLPFGSLVGQRGVGAPLRGDCDHDEWIAQLAEWMTVYEVVLREQVEDLQAQAKRRMALQFEKDSARAWMGVGV